VVEQGFRNLKPNAETLQARGDGAAEVVQNPWRLVAGR
jgi:hypothetical protein